MFEAHGPSNGLVEWRRTLRFTYCRLHLQQFEHASCCTNGFVVAPNERRQRSDGGCDRDRIEEKGDERSRGELPLEDELSSLPEYCDDSRKADESDDAEKQ